MCKNLGIFMPKSKAHEFIAKVSKQMTERDKDGFGIATLSDGGIHRERWLYPKERKWSAATPFDDISEPAHDVLGKKQGKTYAILVHARMATGSVCLTNTHPFVLDDIALIHNGVVEAETEDMLGTTCDSASILSKYVSYGVREDIASIRDAMNEVRGWYACLAVGVNSNGPYMDIWKDESTPLWIGDVPYVGLVVGTSSAYLDSAKWRRELTGNKLIRLTQSGRSFSKQIAEFVSHPRRQLPNTYFSGRKSYLPGTSIEEDTIDMGYTARPKMRW